MSLTQKNLRAIFEEESLAEFINVMDYAKNDLGEGIFYCQNGYRGFSFLIEPSAFNGVEDFKSLISFFDLDLPINSAIQINSIPSQNLENIFLNYFNTHQDYEKVKEKERLKKFNEERLKWLRYSVTEGLINEKFPFYPKNWMNLVTIMIPEYNKKKRGKNSFITDFEILSYKNKALSKLIHFQPREVSPSELIKIMSELLDKIQGNWSDTYDENTPINQQLISSSTKYYDDNNGIIEIKDERGIKKSLYCQIMTTKKFPEKLNLGLTQNLFIENFDEKSDEPYIKTPFLTCVNIIIEDKQKEKGLLQAKTKNNQWQTKMMGNGVKFFPKLEEIDSESRYIDYLITNHNETIYRMQYSICVFADKKSKLEEQISSIESAFSKKNWELQIEIDMALPVFLYSLPFQFDLRYKDFSKKFKTTLRSNNAAATPLLNDMKGSFGRVPLFLTFGRTGQIQFFDNFGTDGNANVVIAAGSRAGKTFTILDFVASSLSTGRMVRIIEAGKNFEAIAQEFGGKFLRFSEKDNVCLNFFTDAKTLPDDKRELHPHETTTMIPLIGLMIGKKLISSSDDDFDEKSDSAIISAYVEKAVRNAYRNNLRQTNLKHVKDELTNIFNKQTNMDKYTDERLRDLITAISPYADEEGRFYKYFNGPRNVYFSDNPLVIFELNDLKNEDENLMFVVLMALIQTVANEFYGEELEDILKNLICDEAWMILDHPFIASFLIRIWRTIGKHKGAGISISQDVDLYFKSKDMEAIYNNSTYKIFLKQDPEQLDKLSAENKLSSDKFFLSKLKSLKSYAGLFSEMLVKVDNSFFISRIIVNKFAFYLYSTPEKVPGFNELMKQLNLKKNETAFIFSLMDMNKGMTVEEAYEELLIDKGIKIREKEKVVNNTKIKNEIEDENNELQIESDMELSLFSKFKRFISKFLKKN
ncbi:TraC family protein (plasmid) [Aliarcobacter lanthieri]|uniref:TraC family protein n=1 Tax=Aliarcobacter lanthieri TaxID=1355374 RepID=UPI003AAA6B4D